MSARSWLQRLGACLDAAEATEGDPQDLRNLLFGLYRLLETGTAAVQGAFQDLQADDLSDDAQDLGEQLSQGEYVRPAAPKTLAEGVALAAKLLRGAEQAVLGLGQATLAPRRAKDLEVGFGDEQGWLLPFRPRFRGEPEDWPPYFAKRALTRMRCLPRELPTGHRIDLQLLHTVVGNDVAGVACLFDKLSLTDSTGKAIDDKAAGPFVVAQVEGAGQQAIANSLQLAFDPAAGAAVVIFPELSISAEDQKELQRLIRTTPWDLPLKNPRPAVVVGGSWHDRREDGRHENRAPVFGGDGQLVGRHVKHAVFGTKTPAGVLREDIVRGEEILVLVGPDLTAAVAICLDFCQAGAENPYDHLDVDLVLVTSMANAGTAKDHGAQAERIWKRRKVATFVAQQSEAGAGGVCGANPTPKTDPGFVKEEAASAVVMRRISSSA